MNRRNIFKLIAGAACAAAMEIGMAKSSIFDVMPRLPVSETWTPLNGRAITTFHFYIQEKTSEKDGSVFQFSDDDGTRWGPIFSKMEEASDAVLQLGYTILKAQPTTDWKDNPLCRLPKRAPQSFVFANTSQPYKIQA